MRVPTRWIVLGSHIFRGFVRQKMPPVGAHSEVDAESSADSRLKTPRWQEGIVLTHYRQTAKRRYGPARGSWGGKVAR